MDRESLERIRQMTKDKITVSNFQRDKSMKNNKIFYIKRISIVACLCIILTSCVLFEKDVKALIKNYFGTGKGIDIAAENGYVAETDMNFIDTENTLVSEQSGVEINDVDVSVKIDEFLMDDLNLSTNFSFKFDDKIKEFLDLDNVQFIDLEDLMIFDEENRVIASTCAKNDFEKMCKQYNLECDFDKFLLEDFARWNKSLNDRNKEENLVKYAINFEANKSFPNSKELNFVFTKIKLEKYNEYNGEDINNGEYLKSKSVILTGNWEINVKVPEKMYNRPKNQYRVVSISNPNIEVDYAGASETGFKLNVTVPGKGNIEFPETLNKLHELYEQKEEGIITEEEYNSKSNELTNSEEYKEASRKFDRENTIITTNFFDFAEDEEKSIDKITHITNSKGKTFDTPTNFTSLVDPYDTEGKMYKFNGTFNMTKADATDELTVTLIYFGEPVEIKLEKIK